MAGFRAPVTTVCTAWWPPPASRAFGRLAGYEDVNDADRLALDPVMRQIVGGRAVDYRVASASQMGRFENEVLTSPDNLTAWLASGSPKAKAS